MTSPLAFEPLLTADDAASLLGIHTNTLFRWARDGRIPCLRYGRSVRFRASALNRWLESMDCYDGAITCAASTHESEAA